MKKYVSYDKTGRATYHRTKLFALLRKGDVDVIDKKGTYRSIRRKYVR